MTEMRKHEGKQLPLHLVDPAKNARRKRPPRGGPRSTLPAAIVTFDPPKVLLDTAVGRNPSAESES